MNDDNMPIPEEKRKCAEIETLRHWLQECLDVINRGVEIVTDQQLGKWNNVRTVVEIVPGILEGQWHEWQPEKLEDK